MRDLIDTDRLTLRRYTAADCQRLVELAGDIRVARNLSRMPHPYTGDHAREWLAAHEDMWAGETERVWAIELRGEGLAGAIGLHWQDRMSLDGEMAWEIGYWLGVPFWGRGLATEAGRAVIAELERAHGPQAMTAGHATDNPQSGHVLAKLGFHKTGVIRPLPNLARGEDTDTVVVFRPATARARAEAREPERLP